jgi:hypothetical protein
MLGGWKRPSEAIPPPNWASAFPNHFVDRALGPSMALKPGVKVDLVQDAATDCSVVASFSAGIARGEKGHPRVSLPAISTSLFPSLTCTDSCLSDSSLRPALRCGADVTQRKVHNAHELQWLFTESRRR